MSITTDFQKDVSIKLNNYFEKGIINLQEENPHLYYRIRSEYDRQLNVVQQTQFNHNINIRKTDFNKNWLKCISEPTTEYNLADLTNRDEDNNERIYSPRMDISITPTVIKNRSKLTSLGVYRLSQDVEIFNLIHELHFIRELENTLREISDCNLGENHLNPPQEVSYINTRPMHLFGIEIENQKNPKHLMGDFLNAISLSKIPIILFPEDKFIGCMKMLLFSTTIKNLKEVPIYDVLNNAIILKVNQFRSAINNILEREGLETIQTIEYR